MNERRSEDHTFFKQLAALAEVGELQPEEYDRLRTHLSECAQCREVTHDYSEILFGLLPAVHPTPVSSDDLRLNLYLKELDSRLDAAAAQNHPRIPVPTARLLTFLNKQPLHSLKWAALLLLISATGILAGSLLWSSYHGMQDRLSHENHSLQRELQLKNTTIASLQETLDRRSTATAEVLPEKVSNKGGETLVRSLRDQNRSLMNELEKMRSDYERSLAESRQLSDQLQNLQAKWTVQERKLKESASELGKLRAQIQGFRGRIQELEQSLAASQVRPDPLPARLLRLESLLGAPSLKITDIYNVVNRSALPNAFGRLLTADGQPVLLYFFGLSDPFSLPQPGASASRQRAVWGLKGDDLPIEGKNAFLLDSPSFFSVPLGTARVDDIAQDRWVLQLDEPGQLSGLRYLLITSSRSSNTGRPTGEVLFYGIISKP